MVAYTSTYTLPYAQSTDRICDGATITQQLAEAVDAVLNTFDTDANRLELVPYARMSVSTAYEADVLNNSNLDLLLFDTVDTDTAGMADSVKDNRSFHVATDSGIWLAGALAWMTNADGGSTPGNATTLYVVVNQPAENDRIAQQSVQDRDNFEPTLVNTSSLLLANDDRLADVQVGSYLALGGTYTTGDTITINPNTRQFMWWVTDAPP